MRKQYLIKGLDYRKIKTLERKMIFDGYEIEVTPCYYCGIPSESIDHVPPRCYVQELVDLGIVRMKDLFLLPACIDCNVVLGRRPLYDLDARRQFISIQLAYKFSHMSVLDPEFTLTRSRLHWSTAESNREVIIDPPLEVIKPRPPSEDKPFIPLKKRRAEKRAAAARAKQLDGYS